jgi:hypothetical protein
MTELAHETLQYWVVTYVAHGMGNQAHLGSQIGVMSDVSNPRKTGEAEPSIVQR